MLFPEKDVILLLIAKSETQFGARISLKSVDNCKLLILIIKSF
jgi:hypothetical protein